MATSAAMDQAITKALIPYEKIMRPVAQFVATQVKKEVSEVAPSSVIIARPSPPP